MKNLYKHLSNVTNKKGNRPILMNLLFNSETNTISATDSYRLLAFKQEVENSFLLNPSTLETQSVENYPNIQPLLNQGSTTINFNLNLLGLNNLLSSLKATKDKEVAFIMNGEYLSLKNSIFNHPITHCKEKETLVFNRKYLVDCISFLFDYRKKNPESEITFSFSNDYKPTQFISEDFTYVICPIKVK